MKAGVSRISKLITLSYPHSSTLNLPRSAAQNEIRERYRALSVTFHPDKQHDESIKATASKKFLEIQKAYESEYIRIDM